jgi:hypothetical protein
MTHSNAAVARYHRPRLPIRGPHVRLGHRVADHRGAFVGDDADIKVNLADPSAFAISSSRLPTYCGNMGSRVICTLCPAPTFGECLLHAPPTMSHDVPGATVCWAAVAILGGAPPSAAALRRRALRRMYK